ncbi:DUF2332 domain-containing protein [Microbacterium karelineae]|uniref:DUF2332 domain-containing protein n=1 Tax=Microbacterium karelineae TaxID=2654283 RepID=UPI0012EAEC60|nr:DUF2332 domain-containing protein [Microbacterium karelineae]
MDPDDVRARYARFARDEAPGRSEVYAEWAAGVADDAGIALILAGLPSPHRQPPVVFAVTRMLGAPVGDYPGWARFVRENAERIVDECRARTTQTNEPLRCAPLVIALERVRGPIALIEVGASAGLCLFPDRYAYRFRTGDDVIQLGGGPVRLDCELRGGIRAPRRLPDIVWRAGIDLQPRDARDGDDRAWIEGLVWPGETEREARIGAALDIAAADPPLLIAGDATEPGVLADLVARAPADATVGITTPGVLPHIPRAARTRLIDEIRRLPARWITIDGPGLHDAWAPPIDADAWDGFVLALDGRPISAVDPLGGWTAPASTSA